MEFYVCKFCDPKSYILARTKPPLSIIDKWMTARIIGNGDCPDDFGIYITKQNIDDHINTIKMDILNLRNINDTWHIFFDEEYVAENG